MSRKFDFVFLIFVFAGFIYAQADSKANKNNESSQISQKTKICYVFAKTGDTILSISERINVSAITVAKFNGLFTNSKLPKGREVRIPYEEGNKPSECGDSKRKNIEEKDTATKLERKTANNSEVVRAELGDTVESLACRHNVSPEAVAEMNKLSIDSRLLFAQKITIPAKKDYKCVNQTIAKLVL